MIYLKEKVLSVNDCWRGKRFKTPEYKAYEKKLLWLLPKLKLPESPLSLGIEYGFSSSGADLDNPTKPLLDVLQKKYHFNDNEIYELVIIKRVVAKGEEYFSVNFETLNDRY